MILFAGIFVFGFISNINAQQAADSLATPAIADVMNHRVEQGETVMLICKKYLVQPKDVYAINPSAVNGIAPNTILHIPVDKSLISRKELENRLKPKKRALTANR